MEKIDIHAADTELKKSVKQVIVLRKDLNMRKGKMVAQGSHASLGSVLKNGEHVRDEKNNRFVIVMDDVLEAWLVGNFRKVVVGCDSEPELLALADAAEKAGLRSKIIVDNGLTEFNGIPTITALAIGPNLAADIDPITGHLKLI